MSTLPRLILRYNNRIELTLRNQPAVTNYRFSGHKTLDGAFTAPVNMFTVEKSTVLRSPTIIRKKLGLIDEVNRGLTKVVFDPDDYSPLNINLPTDPYTLYVRVEDEVGGVYQPYSPVYVIPPANFFAAENQGLTLYGRAPGITALPGDPHPATAMVIVLPRGAVYAEIVNLNPVGAANLLFSFGFGTAMIPILPTDKAKTFDDSVQYIALASGDGAPAPFSLILTMRGL